MSVSIKGRVLEPSVLVASFLMFFWTFDYDVSIIPDAIKHGFSLVIAIATTCGVGFLIALALVTMFRPSALPVRALSVVASICALGGALCVQQSGLNNPVLYYLGMSLIDICFEWALVLCCLALSRLQPRQIFAYTALSVVTAYILANLIALLPLVFSWSLFIACPLLMIGLVFGRLSETFISLRESQPIVEARIVKPYTWLPLNNKMFLSLLFFMGIFGFAVQAGDISIGLLPSLVVVLLMTALLLLVRRKFNMNLPYQIATLFILLSMLLFPFSEAFFQLGRSMAFSLSALAFYFFLTLILTTMAAHSQQNGLSFVAWGNAIALLGSVLGSLLGYFSTLLAESNPQAVHVIAVLIMTGYIAFVMMALKDVDFTSIIMHIDAGDSTTTLSIKVLHTACEKTAETFNLTQRETDVLELLARGRNSEIIERELVISRNTVKSHVRHIYEKLGCHRQQDLIDIVENNL